MRVIRLHSIHDLQGTIPQDDFSATLRQSILTILSLTLLRMVATLVVVSGGSTVANWRLRLQDLLITLITKSMPVYDTSLSFFRVSSRVRDAGAVKQQGRSYLYARYAPAYL